MLDRGVPNFINLDWGFRVAVGEQIPMLFHNGGRAHFRPLML